MTLLVALALATAVKLRPVLASRVTSGKKRLTVLVMTITLRGSMESAAFAGLLPGDGDCPSAVDERASTTTMNTAANLVSIGPLRTSLILGTIRYRTQVSE